MNRNAQAVLVSDLSIIILLSFSYYGSEFFTIVISIPYLVSLIILAILLLLEYEDTLSKYIQNKVNAYEMISICISITLLIYAALSTYLLVIHYMTIEYYKLMVSEMISNMVLLWLLSAYIDICRRNKNCYKSVTAV